MNRRELLGTLGVASASTLLWAFGCRTHVEGPQQISASGGEVRTWLYDALGILRGGGLESPHALAVMRKRTTAAIDVLGRGVARERRDGVVLTARDRSGAWREQITSDLSAAGVVAAARALVARDAAVAKLEPSKQAVWPAAFAEPDDGKLLERVAAIGANDQALSSRIVYQAASIDIDDSTIWSIAAGRDQEQHLVRVRQDATRVAWNGKRPVTSEVARAWTGGLDDQVLGGDDVSDATRAALVLVTPGGLDEGVYPLVLEPEVVAAIVDAATRVLLTTAAARRPEVAHRLAVGATMASAELTLVDDPTAAGAYGGYHFDDEGEPAAAITLLDRGRVSGRLADRAGVAAGAAQIAGRGRRPGHLGPVEPAASHLRLAAGTGEADKLLDDGYVLSGVRGVAIDPASDRVVIAVARAHELRGGRRTGRVFADLELAGPLATLLGSVTAASQQTQAVALRDDHMHWRSLEAPWLRMQGSLRASKDLA